MGNSNNLSVREPGAFYLRIRAFIKRKHREFGLLRKHLLEQLDEVGEGLREHREFKQLRKLIQSATSYDTMVPFTEL